MTERILLKNRIRCLKCNDVIESTHRHDFVWCKCKSVAVDGGLSYCKRVGVCWTDACVWDDDSGEEPKFKGQAGFIPFDNAMFDIEKDKLEDYQWEDDKLGSGGDPSDANYPDCFLDDDGYFLDEEDYKAHDPEDAKAAFEIMMKDKEFKKKYELARDLEDFVNMSNTKWDWEDEDFEDFEKASLEDLWGIWDEPHETEPKRIYTTDSPYKGPIEVDKDDK
jgi:hypothetical protein